MFGSKGTDDSKELTVIGDGVAIEGSIRVDGSIRVNGRVDGVLIVEGEAAISPGGAVVGDMLADELTIGGRLEGNVSVHGHLHVARSGSLLGDVRYGTLQVDRGAILAGSTVRGEDTISLDAESDEIDLLTGASPA